VRPGPGWGSLAAVSAQRNGRISRRVRRHQPNGTEEPLWPRATADGSWTAPSARPGFRRSARRRLADVAEVMLAGGTVSGCAPSLTALTFAAAAARAAGDTGTARGLLDQALAAADDPDTRMGIVEHLRASGRLADAIEALEDRLREAPDDDDAAERYGMAIEEAYAHVNDGQPTGGCPCGQGAPWQECCGPRERAALSRFTDRSGLIALSDAVGAYLATSGYRRAVGDGVAESLPPADDLDWEPAERAALGASSISLASACSSGFCKEKYAPSGSSRWDSPRLSATNTSANGTCRPSTVRVMPRSNQSVSPATSPAETIESASSSSGQSWRDSNADRSIDFSSP
jgi:tetratricopeptide repeat protein